MAAIFGIDPTSIMALILHYHGNGFQQSLSKIIDGLERIFHLDEVTKEAFGVATPSSAANYSYTISGVGQRRTVEAFGSAEDARV